MSDPLPDFRTAATIVAWLALIAVVAVAMVYAQLKLPPGVKVLINLVSAAVLVASGYAGRLASCSRRC